VKGDANYRRLIDDRLCPFHTPAHAAFGYWGSGGGGGSSSSGSGGGGGGSGSGTSSSDSTTTTPIGVAMCALRTCKSEVCTCTLCSRVLQECATTTTTTTTISTILILLLLL
jgi:hypothetical protein